MLLTSACVLPPTPVSSTDDAASTATAPAAAEPPATRVITDAAGHTVEIPVDPQRIVVVDYNAVEELLALAVTPVGILYGAPDFLADSLTGITVVGNDDGQPNLEVVLQLKPDLIIAAAWWIDDTIYEQLTQIAPTVMIERENFTDWKHYLRNMGELLGRSEQAEQLLAEYDAHVAAVRAALGEDQLAQLEVTAFRPYGDGSAFLIWVNSFSDTILADVGLRHPQAQWDALPEGEERINDLSLELIPLLDADLIFTVAPWNDDTTAFFNSLTDNALWQQLRAVQNNRVYTVGGPWNEGSVIAAHLVLAELAQTLAEGDASAPTATP